MSRRTFASVILFTVVISVIAGWVAQGAIRSPADIAAETAPPTASPILVPAENRILSTDIVSRGTGRFGSPQNLLMATSALKDRVGVVTTFPLVGAEISEGDVALTASGRPLFVLQGAVPVYRDLGPGREGDDVRQLQDALIRLGFLATDPTGVFEADTEAAVVAMYADAGYEPYETPLAQLVEIQALSQELSASLAATAGTQTDVATAQAAASAARARLNLAYSAVGVAEAESNSAVNAASADVAALRAAAVAAQNGSAPTPLVRAQTELRAALLAEQAARDLLEIARVDAQASPWSLDLTAAETSAEAEVLNKAVEVQAKQEAVAVLSAGGPSAQSALAASDLAVAQSSLDATQSSAQQAIAAARAEVTVAQADVAGADAALAAARLARDDSSVTAATGSSASSLLAERLEVATRQIGVQVPADEIVFVTSMPVRVAESLVGSGDPASGPVLVVTNSLVSVDASLALDEAPLVQVGMLVAIDEPALGLRATGVVSRVASAPGTNGVDGFHVYVEILVDDAPVNVVGVSARISIPIESSGGAVLAVPIQAVTLSADGSSRVQRETATGLEVVTVEPGLSADGFVGVTATSGTLNAGDRVVIGLQQAPAGGPTTVPGG